MTNADADFILAHFGATALSLMYVEGEWSIRALNPDPSKNRTMAKCATFSELLAAIDQALIERPTTKPQRKGTKRPKVS